MIPIASYKRITRMGNSLAVPVTEWCRMFDLQPGDCIIIELKEIVKHDDASEKSN